MIIFKSAFNGIGSAAGVAWPFFGIVFSVIGCNVGGPVSLALGGFAVTLFVSIGLSIAYLSYQQMKHEKEQLRLQLQTREEKFTNALKTYIAKRWESYAISSKNTDFSQYLMQQIDKENSLYQVLKIYQIAQQRLELPPKFILKTLKSQCAQQHAPYSHTLIPAFFNFVGTFGSIAGCSAGVSGLLNGVGLFSGFATFPVLGCTIICVAIGAGLCLSIDAFFDAENRWIENKINQQLKIVSQQLVQQTISITSTQQLISNNTEHPAPVHHSPLFEGKEENKRVAQQNFALSP
ncbi:MAG: hypothetical protein QM652_11790 [Legionella sp.]|uniref:hypothetical protein n=1 Tax=Legionella sp. TaxID=459 RepID=UPI0039E51668